LFFGIEHGGRVGLFWGIGLRRREHHQRRCLVLWGTVENPKVKRQRCVTRRTARPEHGC